MSYSGASVDRTDPRTVHFIERLYDAGIRHMDEETLAPLLDLLDGLDLARDTLVVFTSDHGEAFLEHGRFLHDDLHDGTLRVPLILRLPGRLPAGRRVHTPGRLLDLMPTILDVLGVPAPAAAQGRSLLPLLTDDRPDAAPDEVVSEHDNVALGRSFASVVAGHSPTSPTDPPRCSSTSRTIRARTWTWQRRGRRTCRRCVRSSRAGGTNAGVARCASEPGATASPPTRDEAGLRALGYVE